MAVTYFWNEENIRKELERLDTKTGLAGAKLPIVFSNAKCKLGSYSSAGAFCFSRRYFEDSSWPIEEALDTIRHEYAHYMDHMIYGNMGHGSSWKKCCMEIGALPIRCYIPERAQYYQKKHESERRKSVSLDCYKVGYVISHPKFGSGRIVKIESNDARKYATVSFKNMGIKKLSLVWIDENCRSCA